MKKFINQYIFIGLAALSLSFGATSCTDYLDKEPDSDVGADEAFKNFTNFQGFVEEIYNCRTRQPTSTWVTIATGIRIRRASCMQMT